MKKALSILGVLLAASLTGQAITVTEIGVGPNKIVSINGTGLGNPSVYAGIINLKLEDGSNPATFVQGFCIDPFQWSSSSPLPYQESPLASLQNNASPTLTSAQAITIGKLWATYYTAALGDSLIAAKLQLSIWTTVAPGFGFTSFDSVDGAAITAFISAATSQSVIANLTRLSNGTAQGVDFGSQDYVIAGPNITTLTTVPDTGSTVVMLSLALGTLFVLGRRRMA